jgi:uncharacterized membrane protein YjgN (DUF898 family)
MERSRTAELAKSGIPFGIWEFGNLRFSAVRKLLEFLKLCVCFFFLCFWVFLVLKFIFTGISIVETKMSPPDSRKKNKKLVLRQP